MGLFIGNIDKSVLPANIVAQFEYAPPIYGVKFEGVSQGIRLANATEKIWLRSGDGIEGVDDFKSIIPFNPRVCLTKYNEQEGKREVIAYEGTKLFDELVKEEELDEVVEFPCFWYKRPSMWEIYVTTRPITGFNPSPWHAMGGQLKDVKRVSRFAIDNQFTSRRGKQPLCSTNMNTFRNGLLPKGLRLITYEFWCSLTMLMMVKYANLDIQSTVGRGVDSGSAVRASQATLEPGLQWEYDGTSNDNGYNSVWTFRIENMFSNCWKFVDNLYGYNGDLYLYNNVLTKDPTSYTELIANASKIGTKVATSTNWVTDVATDEVYDWMFFPTKVGSNTLTQDHHWYSSNFNCVILGGDAWNGSRDGLFPFAVNDPVGCSAVGYGALAEEI